MQDGQGERAKRSRRLVTVTKRLLDAPGRLISLSSFAAELGVAKSSLSEDIAIIDHSLRLMGEGTIETVTGAAGGVRFVPGAPAAERTLARLAELCAQPDRIMPGGYLYMSDIVFDPQWAWQIGLLLADQLRHLQADHVITVETKGIPLALMTARALDLPLVVIRRDSRVSEGSSVSVNYVSGSGGRIQSMSLPRRALPPRSRALLVDDFLRGGGTARGVEDLLHEFSSMLVGIGVLAVSREPILKRVGSYSALLELTEMDEAARKVSLQPLVPQGELTVAGAESQEGDGRDDRLC